MNISKIFIERPVMTTLFMCALLLFGVVGYLAMPVSKLPNVDYPTIQVTANLSGASPETMSSVVAEPLENVFSTIPGIDSMTSSSELGETRITLQFDFDRNIDGAAQDVGAAIAQAQRRLPKQMLDMPFYKKVDPASSPILYVALTSDQLPMSQVDEYAENILASQLSMLKGVAQVDVYGSQKYAVRIQVNPQAMNAYHVSFDQLIKAVNNNNVNAPTGILNGQTQLRTMKVPGQLLTAQDYRPLIVAYNNGSAMRLSSVANVLDSVADNQTGSWLNKKRSIVIAVRRAPGANTLEVIQRIHELLPRFTANIPKQMQVSIVFDQGTSIQSSVHEVQSNLLIASVLVVLVIFLFLKNISATLIPAIVLPITVIGTFACMALLHFSINNISLMGLTLAVGFFVDDAIVMLENILRHVELGESPLQAALRGSKEIGFTIISMTLSLLAAFIPLIFMPGLIGRLLHEFAITLIIAISLSAVISLTLTPMMASRMLKIKQVNSGFLKRFDQGFSFLYEYYKKILLVCLSRPKLCLVLWFGSLGLTFVLAYFVTKDFVPAEDIGLFMGTTEASLDTSFQAMVGLQSQVVDIVMHNPAVAFVSSFINDHNSGFLLIRLKPSDERPNWHDTLAQLHVSTNTVPGLKTYLMAQPAIAVGGRVTKSQYQVTMQGQNLHELYQYADKLQQRMLTIPGLIDVTCDNQLTAPEVTMDVNRDKAASFHVDMSDIQTTLFNALGSEQISTIYGESDQFPVLLEVQPAFQQSVASLQQLYVMSKNSNLVPLGALGTFKNTVGPQVVNHQNKMPSVTISFNLKNGVSLGEGVSAVQTVIAGLHLPPSIICDFGGNAKAFQGSLAGFWVLIVLALLVIYILLGVLYESFIHPLTILSTIPTAGVGALLVLLLTGSSLNLYGFLGLLMLIGIVKKNAIMMIDFAINAQHRGLAPQQAIFEACLVRFRPIMMTTFAAFMGALPIVFALGAGAEARRSLGLSVAGGLLTSQLLTLFSTPIIYLYMEQFQNYLHRIKQRIFS